MSRDTVPGLPGELERGHLDEQRLGAAGTADLGREARPVDGPLLGLLYLLAAMVSLYLARQPGSVATIWYANAVGAAALLVAPTAQWWRLSLWLAGAIVAANWWWGDPLLDAARFVPGNLLEMLVSAWVGRRAGWATAPRLDALDLLGLLVWGGLVPQMLGATLGCALLGGALGTVFEQVWLPWLEGAAIGAVSALPLAVFVARQGWRACWQVCCQPWMAMLVPLTLGLSLVALLSLPFPFVYLMLPLLLAATLVGLEAVALLTLLASLVVAFTLAQGLWSPPPTTAAWQQVFIYTAYAAAMLPGQLLAAAMGAWRQALQELEARTAALRLANEGLEQFVRMASHDLREPLNSMVQFGGLLQSDEAPHLTPQGRRYLTILLQAGHRMRQLLDDMLAFARVQHEQGRPQEPVDLRPLVEELRVLLAHRSESRSAVWQVGDLPVVLGQPALLTMLLQNLLSNALKFVPADRTPRIEVAAEPLAGGRTRITVRDNGIGLSADDRGRLFQPFQRLNLRRHFEGSGLGLALAQHIALQHGSTIEVDSVPNEGSVFSVVLSLAAAAPSATRDGGLQNDSQSAP